MTTQTPSDKPDKSRIWSGRRNVTNRALLVSIIHRAIHDLMTKLGDTENGLSREVRTSTTVEIGREAELGSGGDADVQQYTRLQAELACKLSGSLDGLFGRRVKNLTILRRSIRQAITEAVTKLGDTEDGSARQAVSEFALDLELVYEGALSGSGDEPVIAEIFEFHLDVEVCLSIADDRPVQPVPIPIPLPAPIPEPVPEPVPMPMPIPSPLPLPPLPPPFQGDNGLQRIGYGLLTAMTIFSVFGLLWSIPEGDVPPREERAPIVEQAPPVKPLPGLPSVKADLRPLPHSDEPIRDVPVLVVPPPARPQIHPTRLTDASGGEEAKTDQPIRLVDVGPLGSSNPASKPLAPKPVSKPVRLTDVDAPNSGLSSVVVQPKPAGPIAGPVCGGGEFHQMSALPAFATSHTRDWVVDNGKGGVWVRSSTDCAKTTVKVFDGSNRLINVQEYGTGGLFQEQRLYLYRQDRAYPAQMDVQVDHYAADDVQLSDRTMYVLSSGAGATKRRIGLAFELNSKHERLLEARITRNADGSIQKVTLWRFGGNGLVTSCRVVRDPAESAEVLRQFREFDAVDQW